MKKIILLVSMLCSLQSAWSQEIYFYTGKNFTTYDYKNSRGNTNPNVKPGQGNFYEIGYTVPFDDERFKYSIGLSLNEYNAVGGNTVSNYSWDTNYLGIKNTISFTMFDSRKFDINARVGFTLSSMVYGKQTINNTYYNLSGQNEFFGLLAEPSLGVQTKCIISQSIYLSLGYNIVKSLNITNSSPEKLSFTTNQLQFGIHLDLY